MPALAPLARLQVRAASLQPCKKEKPRKEAEEPRCKILQLIDRTEDLKDFADTAALIANLDLVICVDTAVAHLAGAQLRQAGVDAPAAFTTDWRRWLREREDSPWYPSMRLFRQPSRADWDGVIERVGKTLTLMNTAAD